MKRNPTPMTSRLIALLASAAIVTVPVAAAVAQTYPTLYPYYTPTALLAAQTVTAATITAAPVAVAIVAQSVGTAMIRITGTFTGLSAQVQVSSERAVTGGSPAQNFSTVAVEPIGGGGGMVKTITAAGLYRVNLNGAAAAQVLLNALSTGSVTVDASLTQPNQFVTNQRTVRPTYSATLVAGAPASATTDLLTLAGNATTTVRVQRIACTGTETTYAMGAVYLVRRSAADTGGTSAALTAVPHDPNDPAASSAPLAYTANPTLGTTVGTLRAAQFPLFATTSVANGNSIAWTFGDRDDEQLTLRGTAQQVAVNFAGATLGSGAAITCDVEWTED